MTDTELARLGWDTIWEQEFAAHRAAGRVPARATRVDRGLCDAVSDEGPLRVSLHGVPTAEQDGSVCTGDWLALEPDVVGADGARVAADVLARRTAVVRGSASGRSVGQVIAANVDTVFITAALDTDLDLGRIERFLALVWSSGARPVVLLTKADRAVDPAGDAAAVSVAAPGADVVVVSTATGDGLDAVAALSTGTVALIGPSGSGKSTLGNALLGEDRLVTGAVRSGDAKGRHTTAHRELVPLPCGGVLIDTPGLRGVGLWGSGDGVDQTFADVVELALGCRFRDCEHDREPGCAVQAAIGAGVLEPRRLASYRKLLREDRWMASRSDARQAAERENQRKAISRSLRATYRFRGR